MWMISTRTYQRPTKDGNVFKILKNKIIVAVIVNRMFYFIEKETDISNFYKISDLEKEENNKKYKMCSERLGRVQR